MKKITESLLTGIVEVATALSGCTHAQLQQLPVKNIVLVHGAFADGTSWAKVISIPTCHVAMLQEPQKVADLITEAAKGSARAAAK